MDGRLEAGDAEQHRQHEGGNVPPPPRDQADAEGAEQRGADAERGLGSRADTVVGVPGGEDGDRQEKRHGDGTDRDQNAGAVARGPATSRGTVRSHVPVIVLRRPGAVKFKDPATPSSGSVAADGQTGGAAGTLRAAVAAIIAAERGGDPRPLLGARRLGSPGQRIFSIAVMTAPAALPLRVKRTSSPASIPS